MTIPAWESLNLVSEPMILGYSPVLMGKSGGGSNQLEQQIQAFMDRSNRRLQYMEEWYQNRFQTFYSAQNQYDFQRSESKQRVSGDAYTYHQYAGANLSVYRDSYGDFTGRFANPTNEGCNYLDLLANAHPQLPYAYHFYSSYPSFYVAPLGESSIVSVTSAATAHMARNQHTMTKRFKKNRKKRDYVNVCHGRIRKHKRHPSNRGSAEKMHHHRILFDIYYSSNFRKVSTRYFHKRRDLSVQERTGNSVEDQLFDKSPDINEIVEISHDEFTNTKFQLCATSMTLNYISELSVKQIPRDDWFTLIRNDREGEVLNCEIQGKSECNLDSVGSILSDCISDYGTVLAYNDGDGEVLTYEEDDRFESNGEFSIGFGDICEWEKSHQPLRTDVTEELNIVSTQYEDPFLDLVDPNFVRGLVEELIRNENGNCDIKDSFRLDQHVIYILLNCSYNNGIIELILLDFISSKLVEVVKEWKLLEAKLCNMEQVIDESSEGGATVLLHQGANEESILVPFGSREYMMSNVVEECTRIKYPFEEVLGPRNKKDSDLSKCFDEKSERDIISWTSLIVVYSKFEDIVVVTELLKRLTVKDVMAWTVRMFGFVQNGKTREIFSFFHWLESAGVEINEVTLMGIVLACAKLGVAKYANWVYVMTEGYDLGPANHVKIGSVLMDKQFKYGKCDNEFSGSEKTSRLPCLEKLLTGTMGLGEYTLKLHFHKIPNDRGIFKVTRKKKVVHGVDRYTMWLHHYSAIHVLILLDTVHIIINLAPQICKNILGRCECVNLETNNNETYWFEVASDRDEVIAYFEYNIDLTEALDLKKKTKVWKVTHVVVASCTAVLKLSVLAYITSLKWDEIHRVEKLFPIVVNIISLLGHETCSPLVFHHKIEILAFIGSGSTGVKIMTGATKLVKPVTLKLGGKSSIVVFDDIHALEKSVEWTLVSCFWIKFQRRVTSGLLLQKLTASQILEYDCNLGFLISFEQYEKVLKYKILCLFVLTLFGEFILVKYNIRVLIDQVGKFIREFRTCCSKTYTLDVIFKIPCEGMLPRSVEIYYMCFVGFTAMTQKVVIEFAFTVVALICLVFAAIVPGMNFQEDEGVLVKSVMC